MGRIKLFMCLHWGKTVTVLFNWKHLQLMNQFDTRFMFFKQMTLERCLPLPLGYILLILGPDIR